MKTIKNILLILLVSLSAALNAQEITNTFPGTWHYDNGNQRFIVKIWQEGNYLRGHYKMVSMANNSFVSVIYDSKKAHQNEDGLFFPPTIFGELDMEINLYGGVCDNTIIGNPHDCKRGQLRMKMEYFSGCTTCPVTATWEVTEYQGMRVGELIPFNIPTNITLTKVSDTVNLD